MFEKSVSFSLTCSAMASLNTIVKVANRDPHPFVFFVLNLTVANVDSMTLVDLI